MGVIRSLWRTCRPKFGSVGSPWQIASLEQQKEKIANRLVRLRNLEAAKERKRRTRRLILIGSYMEHVTDQDNESKDRLIKGLDKFLTRHCDCELFDLPLKEGPK